MKENINDRFIKNIKIASIIIAIIFAIFKLYPIITKENNYEYDLSIEIAGSLIVGLLVYLTWSQIQLHELKLKNENEKERVALEIQESENRIKRIIDASITEVHRLNAGLREIEVDEVFKLATQFITNCSVIRVIGTAKQNYSEFSTNETILNYLDETIVRIKKVENLKYRRITSLDSTNKFIDHLSLVLDNNKPQLSHDLKIMILDNFVPAYTYLIIDENFLMLTLNYDDQSILTKHYYSQNKKTVQNFIKHFKTIWLTEENSNKILDNSLALEHYVDFRKRTNEYFKKINNHLLKFPESSTYSQEHVIEELKQTASRIKGLSSKEFEVHHTISNGNILRLFCIYLNKLKYGDIYQTITFRDFWEDILNEDRKEPNFLRENKRALNEGAKILRTLIVKYDLEIRDGEKNSTYSKDIAQIIKQNIELKNSIKNPDNYSFRIFFTEKHDYLRRCYYNFALITSEKKKNRIEKILFEPCNNPSYDSTKILFHNCNFNDVESNVSLGGEDEVHFKFVDTEEKLQEIEKKWNTQKIENFHKTFLKEIDEFLFDFDKNEKKLEAILGNEYST